MKNKKEIKITIEGETWEKALDKAYKKKNKEERIEGFRKGMAPKDVYIKKMGIETLFMDAVDYCADDAYKQALKEAEITPIVEPLLDILTINEKEVVFLFTIIGKPEIELGEYKNLGIKKEKVEVLDNEIDEEISKLQDNYAEITEKDGEIKKGDTAVIDFEGFVDGKALEGGSGENYPLEIGSNTFIPGFEDELIGLKSGDTKELNLKFPENYVDNLKGKDVLFKVTIKVVKERIVPKLNEDFYKDLGYDDIKTEKEFREEVKSALMMRKTEEIDDLHLDKCLEKAAENMKVEINEEIINDEIHRMIHQFEEQLKMQGINLEDYEKFTGLTHEKMHENMKEEATKRVKYRFLLEEIANAENIDFTDKEVSKRTKEMAENYGITPEELIKAYGNEEIVKYDMVMHRALEIIKENN